MRANFLLNDPKLTESSVYIALTGSGKRIKIGTGVIVNTSEWNADTQMWDSPHNHAGIANLKLNEWKRNLLSLMTEADIKGWTLMDVKEHLLAEMGKGVVEAPKTLFLPYFEHWACSDTSKKTASRHLVYSYNLLRTFTRGSSQLTFDQITIDWCERYTEWMRLRGLNPNTRGTQIKHVKTVMKEAYDRGLHKNEMFRQFRKEKEDVENIALTPEEVQLLEGLDLCGTKELARDLFLLGCYTALRFSDYSRLTIFDGEDGFIRLNQQKTKGRVVIPCSPKCRAILVKWNGAPKLSQQKLNGNIKQICRDAGITQREHIVQNGKLKTVERWELVSSHTARRTAATNMYRAGIPSISIMKITGHTTEANFLKYIKLSKEENALLLQNNAFFK